MGVSVLTNKEKNLSCAAYGNNRLSEHSLGGVLTYLPTFCFRIWLLSLQIRFGTANWHTINSTTCQVLKAQLAEQPTNLKELLLTTLDDGIGETLQVLELILTILDRAGIQVGRQRPEVAQLQLGVRRLRFQELGLKRKLV